MTPTAQAVVSDLCSAWERRDVDAIVAVLADDCIYRNVPLGPLVGRAAIRPFVDEFLRRWETVEIVILNTLSARGLVMNERIDRFSRDGVVFELPVAGVFEVVDGRITRWTDYWDLATWQKEQRSKGGER